MGWAVVEGGGRVGSEEGGRSRGKRGGWGRAGGKRHGVGEGRRAGGGEGGGENKNEII